MQRNAREKLARRLTRKYVHVTQFYKHIPAVRHARTTALATSVWTTSRGIDIHTQLNVRPRSPLGWRCASLGAVSAFENQQIEWYNTPHFSISYFIECLALYSPERQNPRAIGVPPILGWTQLADAKRARGQALLASGPRVMLTLFIALLSIFGSVVTVLHHL